MPRQIIIDDVTNPPLPSRGDISATTATTGVTITGNSFPITEDFPGSGAPTFTNRELEIQFRREMHDRLRSAASRMIIRPFDEIRADSISTPELEEDEEEVEEDLLTPQKAVELLNNEYHLKLDKAGRISENPKEIIVQEAAPICEEEELVVNYKELADQLTKDMIELKHGHFDENTMIDEYIDLVDTIEEKIKTHKRKINV